MIKIPILLSLMLVCTLCTYAQQNHVPNGNFEYYTQCPNSGSQTIRCTGWTDFSPSSDYYNCSLLAMNKSAHSGTGYMGGYCMFAPSNLGFSERFSRAIIPLTPGLRYEVSMSVMLVYHSKYSGNHLGAFFYSAGYQSGIPTPQATFLPYGPIKDTNNWRRIVTSFTPDSAYSNIVIGGFYNSSTFLADSFSSGSGFSYYIFDSIVVKLIDSFNVMVTDTNLCALDTVQVSYGLEPKRNVNNVFTAQLSDKNGNFTNAVTIGTKAADSSGTMTCLIPSNITNGSGYRVRILSSSPVDTTNNVSHALNIANPDSSAINISVNSPLCQGNTIQFAAGTNISSTMYMWSGPNGFNSTSGNPIIVNAASVHNGDYIIAANFYGCAVKDTLAVMVNPKPLKPLANSNTSVCQGVTVNLTASTSTGGVTWSWVGPNSFTSNSQNPTLTSTTTAMTGDYIVTANLNGCVNKDTTTVTIKPLPATFTLSNNSPICAGATLQLNATASTTGATYAWTGPNSFAAGTRNTSVSNATTASTGWYKLSVDLAGCSLKDSIQATVHPIPAVPSITFSNPLCVGETLSLNASTVSGANYSWTGPGSFTANTQNTARVNMQFNDTGTYNVIATANGCSSSAGSAIVHINPVPFVVMFATPADSICQGDPVVFTALPNNAGGTPQYRWMVNTQTAGSGSVFTTSSLNDKDVISCEMTESTKCTVPYKDLSNDIEMTVLPWLAPAVSITAIPNRPLNVDEYVTFTAMPTNAGNIPLYQWKRNGQNIQGATGSVWSANTLNDNDEICVEVTSTYKCPQPTTAKSNCINVNVLSTVDGVSGIGNLVLYPNPNNGRFVLKGNLNTNEELSVEVINTVGQVLYKDIIELQSEVLYKEIVTGYIPAGIYLLRLHNSLGNVATMRFKVE